MSEVAALDQKIETLRQDVSEQFSGIRSDIKDLTKALRELIRLDGEVKSVRDLSNRIGKQVDDHEKRIRTLETNSTANATAIKSSSGVALILLVAGLNVLTGVIVYGVTH